MHPMQPTDEELIEAHLKGDGSAFPALVGRYLDQAYDLALRLGGGDDANDITQEAFIKAWRNLKRYRREAASFRTWMFAILRNTAIDFARKKSRKGSSPFSAFDTEDGGNRLLETLPDDAPQPDDLFAEAESKEALERALAALPFRAREVLLLKYFEDMTFDEIGRALGEPLNTVKSRHRRALALVRSALKKDQNGTEPRI